MLQVAKYVLCIIFLSYNIFKYPAKMSWLSCIWSYAGWQVWMWGVCSLGMCPHLNGGCVSSKWCGMSDEIEDDVWVSLWNSALEMCVFSSLQYFSPYSSLSWEDTYPQNQKENTDLYSVGVCVCVCVCVFNMGVAIRKRVWVCAMSA